MRSVGCYNSVRSISWIIWLTNIQRLAKQLEDLDIPFVDDFPTALASSDHVVDAIFGSLRISTAKDKS